MMKQRLSRSGIYFTVALLLTFLTGCAPKTEEAPQPPKARDAAAEQVFEKQLGEMNPAAVPVFHEATIAWDAGDYEKASTLFETVIKMAPDFSTAYRRLGNIEFSQNNTEKGFELVRKALALESSGYNQAELAIDLVTWDGTPAASQEAFTLASQAVEALPDYDYANTALLLAAAQVNNIDVARKADEHLLEISPASPLAHYFAGLLAADAKHWEKAEAELKYSQRLGVDAETVQNALTKTNISRNAAIVRFLKWCGLALVAWLLGLGILYATGSILSKATLRSLSRMEPTIGAKLQPAEKTIRSIYRAVIVVLSIYFYLSMPFVVLALFFVVGGAFYLFFLIGTIPIQLAALLAIMLLTSLFAMIRSAFVRRKNAPAGRILTRTDAPALWEMAERVAKKMGTKPVDFIYVTPFAGISVNEGRNPQKRTGRRNKRNLFIGMGVLCGLNQGQLAAILAHEYGHFQNRDTAGGTLAFRIYSALNEMAYGLSKTRSRVMFNPLWLFLVNFQKIYMRVTLGASRLQEVLADRFAAMAYGRDNFVEGLKNIVKQTIAFQLNANFEVQRAFELHQPILNIYQLPIQEKVQGEVNKRFDAAMAQKTSAYDSHPSTQERIALIERMRIPYALDQENAAPVADLIPNFESLQQNLTAELLKNVRRK